MKRWIFRSVLLLAGLAAWWWQVGSPLQPDVGDEPPTPKAIQVTPAPFATEAATNEDTAASPRANVSSNTNRCTPVDWQAARPALPAAAMTQWKRALPMGPWTEDEVYVLLDALQTLGVYAADVLPLGQEASLEDLSKDSALASLSTVQLEAHATRQDAEAWRLLGLQEINSAWERKDGKRRITNIEKWKAGIEKLGQAAALGSDRALAQAAGTTYMALWSAAKRADPLLPDLRISMHTWHQLAKRYGNAANVTGAAANDALYPQMPAATREAMGLTTEEEVRVDRLLRIWSSRLENVFPLAPAMREKLIAVGSNPASLPDSAFSTCK